MMFCTTFLSAPSEDVLENMSKPDASLLPLQRLVLSRDGLKASLPCSCINTLSKCRSDGRSGGARGYLWRDGRGHRKVWAFSQGERLRRLTDVKERSAIVDEGACA